MSRARASTTPPQCGLRERKKLETHAALAGAAMRLALQHGLDALRVEDIAAAANVSMRTFNNYFASKQDALAARYVSRMTYAAVALRARPKQEPLWEAIMASMLAPWSDASRGHTAPGRAATAELRIIFGTSAVQAEVLRAALAADHPFTLAVAERIGVDAERDLYPMLVTASVAVVAQVAVNAYLRADPPVPLVPLLRNAMTQLSAGLPAPACPRPPN